MTLVQTIGAKRIVQFFCAVVIAVTGILHVDVNLASRSGSPAFSTTQDADQTAKAGIDLETCNFCSGTATFHDLVTAADRRSFGDTVPSGPARRLASFRLPATAPPPKS